MPPPPLPPSPLPSPPCGSQGGFAFSGNAACKNHLLTLQSQQLGIEGSRFPQFAHGISGFTTVYGFYSGFEVLNKNSKN
jgi:hypothetical protein